jgi:hypothetical protein
MATQKELKPSWIERRREKKRLKLERTGDSPEKRTERERKATTDEGASRAASGNVAGTGIL